MTVTNNRFFKLPFHFEQELLQQDLAACVSAHWKQHFNQADYSGEWTSIALRSSSGMETDIYAHPDAAGYMDTPLLDQCPYFKKVLEAFDCEKESARLLSLAPGSEIKEHRDPHTAYEYGFFRLHIPLQTSSQVSFRVDGCELDMKSGECWYANFHLPHSVKNDSASSRVHLIIDCRRNAWSDAVFKEAGYDFEEEKRNREYDQETKQKMIEALSLMDTETSRSLVAQLKQELENNP
jgi:aspartyl/asparaginyl beta-hydroxylase